MHKNGNKETEKNLKKKNPGIYRAPHLVFHQETMTISTQRSHDLGVEKLLFSCGKNHGFPSSPTPNACKTKLE